MFWLKLNSVQWRSSLTKTGGANIQSPESTVEPKLVESLDVRYTLELLFYCLGRPSNWSHCHVKMMRCKNTHSYPRTAKLFLEWPRILVGRSEYRRDRSEYWWTCQNIGGAGQTIGGTGQNIDGQVRILVEQVRILMDRSEYWWTCQDIDGQVRILMDR